MSRFWVSWWTKYLISDGCTQPPFQMWESGLKADDNDEYTVSSMCAVIDAEDEGSIWKVIQYHFPDYEARFCKQVDIDFQPGDRFPDFEGRTSLYAAS